MVRKLSVAEATLEVALKVGLKIFLSAKLIGLLMLLSNDVSAVGVSF